MNSYSVVVIGMGKRGKHHAAAFQENDRFRVTGICDIAQERLAEGQELLGDGVETSTEAAALMGSLKPDVLCFCTMPHLREPFIRMAIENDAKLVAFEKPLADSSANGLVLRELIGGSGIKAVISHQHRYGEHYAKVKEIAASGALGKIHTIYASTPGWMMHMITHLVEYMNWYNDYAPAEWVMAQAGGRRKLDDAHPSPDYIAGFINYANGVRGVVETGAGAPNIPEVAKWWGRNRILVTGDEGFAEVLTNGGWRCVTKDGAESGEGAMNYDHDTPAYVQDIANWLDDDNCTHPCSVAYAYAGFEIAMAMCRSAVDGGQVALPLTDGRDELAEMRERLADRDVQLGSSDHAEEYGMG